MKQLGGTLLYFLLPMLMAATSLADTPLKDKMDLIEENFSNITSALRTQDIKPIHIKNSKTMVRLTLQAGQLITTKISQAGQSEIFYKSLFTLAEETLMLQNLLENHITIAPSESTERESSFKKILDQWKVISNLRKKSHKIFKVK